LPAAAVEAIAGAVGEMVRGGLLLEVGAGTGEIGTRLAALGRGAGGFRYLGLDLSFPMLLRFRARVERGRGAAPALLVHADADRPWPVAAGTASGLFLSRAAHLLRSEALVREAVRVAHPRGLVFVLGNVRRNPESVRTEMRRRMRRLLAEHGVAGRSGERTRRRLLASLERRGGVLLPPRTAASWNVIERPGESLTAWREKSGLAGRAIEPELRALVLDRLEGWARKRFGNLEAARETEERYELAAVRLVPSADAAPG
jgi:SAM-dependent methyltransferase